MFKTITAPKSIVAFVQEYAPSEQCWSNHQGGLFLTKEAFDKVIEPTMLRENAIAVGLEKVKEELGIGNAMLLLPETREKSVEESPDVPYDDEDDDPIVCVARRWLVDYLRGLTEPWPEDDWITLSNDWDINLWTDEEDGSRHAVIYPVANGSTRTQRGLSIDLEPILNELASE